MASKHTLRLREIQPHDRMVKPSTGPGRAERRRPEHQRHVRKAFMPDGSFVLVRLTQRRPWTVRGQRRLRNRIAKMSRRANR